MTASTCPADVVAGYSDRLPFITAEVAAVPAPRVLPQLLTNRSHAAELPCGPGHFLARYAAAGSRLTLVDGNPTMLTLAHARALAAGMPPDRLHTQCALLADLPRLGDVDLVILPGGALNQLAAQTNLPDLLTCLHRLLPARTRLVAQVCCRHNDGEPDQAGFLDPTQPDGVWFTDRRWPPAAAGPAVARRRRQYQVHAGRYRIDFAYLAARGAVVHKTTVELVVPLSRELISLLRDVGCTDVELTPGGKRGLSEVVCTAAVTSRTRA